MLTALGSEWHFNRVELRSVLMNPPVYNPTFYIQVYSEFRRYPTAISANILAIVNTGAFFGRIVAGFVADRLGPCVDVLKSCVAVC